MKLLLVLGCAQEALPPLPAEAVAKEVVIEGEGWGAAAAALRFAGASARAEEVAVVRAGEDRPPLSIVALRSEWDLRARKAHFEGDVVVTRADVVIRCAVLDVTYADASRIDRIVATGGVRVEHGERRASSETAEIEGTTGRLVLAGHPRLEEGANTLVGERIELWLDDERATCAGVAASPCSLVVTGASLR